MLLACPIFTYGIIRNYEQHAYAQRNGDSTAAPVDVQTFQYALWLHFLVCTAGAVVILFYPALPEDYQFRVTTQKVHLRVIRWMYWLSVFGFKFYVNLVSIAAINKAVDDLHLVRPGRTSVEDITKFAFSPTWDKGMVQWLLLFGTGFWLFCSDTQFWVVLGCTILGTLKAWEARACKLVALAVDDAISLIPQRFSEKVLMYCNTPGAMSNPNGECAMSFPAVWDRIIDFMHFEDKIDDSFFGTLSFDSARTFSGNPYEDSDEKGRFRLSWVADGRIPMIFHPLPIAERCIRRDMGMGSLKDKDFPPNADAQWRLTALSRAVTLTLPRPYRVPFVPGLTVLVPHYADCIAMVKKGLYDETGTKGEIVPLMSWLKHRYEEEFSNFSSRMQKTSIDSSAVWRTSADDWSVYDDEQWKQICEWASMRNQTLWRTIAGMTMYHHALDCHWEVQRETQTNLANDKVWDASELFTCIISMQLYPFFDKNDYDFTNAMLDRMPKSLKVTFIDIEPKGEDSTRDGIHEKQQRRYFSCIIDKQSKKIEKGRREARLRIELPGFPILGDGKGDNQNHAIPFTRGSIIQCIDANQGAYFEQMLLLPCALGEFRNSSTGRDRPYGLARRIVGFPEHITSDFGTIGDFAAGAETAFGTMLQRAYALLGSRMHYGHPDMMNKTFVMQQGGVSKATKTVNLSEDIFAGMDFTLRGEGRNIKHTEYLHLAKGRDLGFNTVLTFFAKLSAGTGEQLLTRQMLRLGHVMNLGEFFGFYYAHGGYYLTQHLMSCSVPLLTFIWLLVVLDSPENDLHPLNPIDCQEARKQCQRFAEGAEMASCEAGVLRSAACVLQNGAIVMAGMLSNTFSWLIALFMLATTAPLFVEIWIEQGLIMGTRRLLMQMITGAPIHFIFQAKIIGVYVTNEIRYGGAAYLPTGRGLPTERRAFFSKAGGLYLDWANLAFYDGFFLMVGFLLVILAGGLTDDPSVQTSLQWWCVSLCLTGLSWLFAPFVFNPYQFAFRYFSTDIQDWREFFLEDNAKHWKGWYEKTQLKPGTGLRATVMDAIGWMMFIACWYTVVNSKMYQLIHATNANGYTTQFWAFYPTGITSFLVCWLVPLFFQKLDTGEMHLAIFALMVALLDVCESLLTLNQLYEIGWYKTVVAGLIFKYSILSVTLVIVECAFSFKKEGEWWNCLKPAMKLWLQAHRLALDLILSTCLFVTLAPFTLFDRVRMMCCEGCSLHSLLVFRDPGHHQRGEDSRFAHAPSQVPMRAHAAPAPSRRAAAPAAKAAAGIQLPRFK